MNQPERSNDPQRRRTFTRMAAAATVVASVIVAASCRIAEKAGYKPAIGLVMLLSPINLILLVAFASREWPVQRELRQLKATSPAQ